MTGSVAEQLVKNGKAHLKGCVSAKTGKKYDATIVVTPRDKGSAEFTMQFENRGKK